MVNTVVEAFIDEGRCWSRWRLGLDCPNKAEWIIENTSNAGYALMCEPHKDGFTKYPGHYTVIPYTPEDSARLALRVAEMQQAKATS